MQSFTLVGGRLVLVNFLITFSAGASFPFDVVLVSLVLVQGEYLISSGDLTGFVSFPFPFVILTADKEHPCPSHVSSTTSGVRTESVSLGLAGSSKE